MENLKRANKPGSSVSLCVAHLCVGICVCGMWHVACVVYFADSGSNSSPSRAQAACCLVNTRPKAAVSLGHFNTHTHKYIDIERDTHRHAHLNTHIHPHTLGQPHAHVSWQCACGRVCSSGPAAASIINGLRSTKVWQLLCCQWRNVLTPPPPSCIFFPHDLP